MSSEENTPDLWTLPAPTGDTHKYTRDAVLIRAGALMTGATRLSARAAQRVGAGLVTLAAPEKVWPIYAGALESVIVRLCDDGTEWEELVATREPALLLGPGLGIGEWSKQEIIIALQAKRPTILDADALTVFAQEPHILFAALHAGCVLTPHEGEFQRLFGTIEGEKPERALQAAKRAGCVVLLKGTETYITDPAGRVRVNHTGTPWLATGGSGDVLSGMIVGLLAQKMTPFDAASAAAWLHGRIARAHGAGLIAEDIVAGIPAVLGEMLGRQRTS